MASNEYWNSRFLAARGVYQCPWCPEELQPRVSNSAKNPGKTYVACNKERGGCGMFCFLDAEPNEKFNPNNKRARTDTYQGTTVVGSVANGPNVTDTRIAELATSVAELSKTMTDMYAKIDKILDIVEG